MTRLFLVSWIAVALQQAPAIPAAPAPFHWHDDYTEYHLLEPASHQFAIVYFLNQRREGMAYVLNQTRSGSEGSDIAVSDPRTGLPLKFDYKTGKELAAEGVPGNLSENEHYIRAFLPRPVPRGGEGRVRIEKTYTDEKSYFSSADTLTFARSLGIGRNAIVLPKGYGLVSSNVAADITTTADGRTMLSFENINGYASDVNVRFAPRAGVRAAAGASSGAASSDKALYEIGEDGIVKYRHERVYPVNGNGLVELPSSQDVTAIEATDMDTGEPLGIVPSTQRTRAASARVRTTDGEPRPRTAQIRVMGTLRERADIRSAGLAWSRTISEVRATIVLPKGFETQQVNVPATAGTLPDGRMYLNVVNNRAGSVLRVELRAIRPAPHAAYD
jgi:hypothetical protein